MIQTPVEAQLTEYLHHKAARMLLPINGTFELTPLCNMQCKMCYVRMERREQEAVRPLRTADEWIALAQEAKEHGLLYLLITGGEPFSRPDFRKILSRLHALGLIISVNTNATMIDEQTVAWLKESPPVRFNITLYGASNETYARLCGNPQGFTQTVRAIRLLKAAGFSIKLNCSVTPYNKNDLEAIFAFAKQEELFVQATSYMFPPLRRDPKQIGQNDRFSPEEAAYYAAKIEALGTDTERFLQSETGTLKIGSDCLETEGEEMRCRAGRASFWVTWEGRLMPCGMLSSECAPDVFETGFAAAWKQTCDTVAQIRLSAECKNCGAKQTCQACAAMVLTESGSYTAVPDYRCRMTQAYGAQRRRVQEELRSMGNNPQKP